jgi:hypothetical protein
MTARDLKRKFDPPQYISELTGFPNLSPFVVDNGKTSQ